MKYSVTKWGMTACISTPSAFEVSLKHTSKLRDQSRFALMSYRGHGGCSGTAQDIRPFTVGLKKRLQGSLGQKLKGGYNFNKWLMHCSKWKNNSGRIGLCTCSRSKKCMPVKKQTESHAVVIHRLIGATLSLPLKYDCFQQWVMQVLLWSTTIYFSVYGNLSFSKLIKKRLL